MVGHEPYDDFVTAKFASFLRFIQLVIIKLVSLAATFESLLDIEVESTSSHSVTLLLRLLFEVGAYRYHTARVVVYHFIHVSLNVFLYSESNAHLS